jgi:hypothetical protein
MAIDSLHLKLCHWVERLSRIKAFDVFYSDVLNFLRVEPNSSPQPIRIESAQDKPQIYTPGNGQPPLSCISRGEGKGVPFVLHGERQVLGIWQDCSTHKYPGNGANDIGLLWKLTLIF